MSTQLLLSNGIGKRLLRGLNGYWGLQESSGTRNDLSGKGNTLTDNNTVTGAVGPSAVIPLSSQFTALNSESLSIASNASVSTGDINFTVAAWVYIDSHSVTRPRIIIGKDNNPAGDREFLVAVQPNDGGINDRQAYFTMFKAVDTDVIVMASNAGALLVATWYFIVVWHDAPAAKIYIAVNNNAPNETATGVPVQATGTSPFRIGARDYAGFSDYHNGRIASVGFWKRTLTTAEKSYLYNSGQGRRFCGSPGFV